MRMRLFMPAGIQATSTPVYITVVTAVVMVALIAAVTVVVVTPAVTPAVTAADTIAVIAAATAAVTAAVTAVRTEAVITVSIAAVEAACIITVTIVLQDIKVTEVLTPAESNNSTDSFYICPMFCLHKPVPDHVLTVLPRSTCRILFLKI
jgi:hypothetical protein